MLVDLSTNYFELFGLPVSFDLDETVLHDRWQALQKKVHPDNFVAGSDAEKRYSMQVASLVNEANKVLRAPLHRAGYLLKLKDIDLDVETDTRMAPEFLMEQMELRESIEDAPSAADPYSAVDSIRRTLSTKAAALASDFSGHYGADDKEAARETARQWQFIDKLQREVADLEASLDDQN